MKGSITIVGTNKATQNFIGESFNNAEITRNGILHKIILNDKKYLLDIKSTYIYDDYMLIFGNLSDDQSMVGNIAFEFHPQNNKKDTN